MGKFCDIYSNKVASMQQGLGYYFLSFMMIAFLSGCMQEKATPKIITDTPKKQVKNVVTITKKVSLAKNEYTLRVHVPQGAHVRILNIKPKYHDAILLKPQKYLIEVTKPKYQKYKRWIDLREDLVLNVVLQKEKNPYDVRYFHYVTQIAWKNHNELFTLEYDSKNKLIWAMQSAYVDYVIQKNPRKIMHGAVFAQGKPWPKIYETELDTLIYRGYFRYEGRNFLFKNNNEIVRYKAGVKNTQATKVGELSRLVTNSMLNYWRLPKEKELHLHNPFKKYQKYFQMRYSRYKKIYFNVPILCTKLKKNSYYSNCSVAYKYNKKTALYDGALINQKHHTYAKSGLYFALNHAKDFALVTPVRSVATQYDKIIFNQKITAEQKLEALTSLLITEELEKKKVSVKNIANKMASKAMRMIFGDPKVKGKNLYSSSNNFSMKLRRGTKHVQSVLFRVKKGSLVVQSLH